MFNGAGPAARPRATQSVARLRWSLLLDEAMLKTSLRLVRALLLEPCRRIARGLELAIVCV